MNTRGLVVLAQDDVIQVLFLAAWPTRSAARGQRPHRVGNRLAPALRRAWHASSRAGKGLESQAAGRRNRRRKSKKPPTTASASTAWPDPSTCWAAVRTVACQGGRAVKSWSASTTSK